jgi:hypothetical protein
MTLLFFPDASQPFVSYLDPSNLNPYKTSVSAKPPATTAAIENTQFVGVATYLVAVHNCWLDRQLRRHQSTQKIRKEEAVNRGRCGGYLAPRQMPLHEISTADWSYHRQIQDHSIGKKAGYGMEDGLRGQGRCGRRMSHHQLPLETRGRHHEGQYWLFGGCPTALKAGSGKGDGRWHVGGLLRWLSHQQRPLEAREGRCRLLSAMVEVGGWREEFRIKQSDRLLSARHEL